VSAGNVETIRGIFAAINAGDIEKVLATMDPDLETEVPAELSAEPDTYHGREGMRRYFSSFQEAMEEIRFEPECFWEAGERVVVSVTLTARGRETGIGVEQQFAQLWSFRAGKAIHIRGYATLVEALRAAGVERS